MGKKGKKPSGKREGAGDERAHMAGPSPRHQHPKIGAGHLLIDIVFVPREGGGVAEGQIKDWQSYQDQKRDHALSWFKQREKENILQTTASFILDKESTSLMFLLPT